MQPREPALPAHTSPPSGASQPLPNPTLWVITEPRAGLPMPEVRTQCVQLFEMPWTVGYQALLTMGFELSFPSPGDLPDSGIEPMSPESSALAGRLFTRPPGKLQASPIYLSIQLSI